MIAGIREAVVQMIHELRDPLAVIDVKDPDLGRRIRRAAVTAARNLGERADDEPTRRYQAALDSLEELGACLRDVEANDGASLGIAAVISHARKAADGLRAVT